jgi:hypothetical protein
MANLSELFKSTDEQITPVEAAVTGEPTLGAHIVRPED